MKKNLKYVKDKITNFKKDKVSYYTLKGTVISVCSILALLFFSYAYYTVAVTGSSKITQGTTANLVPTFTEGETIDSTFSPISDDMKETDAYEKTFTISNLESSGSNVGAEYDVFLDISSIDKVLSSEDLKWELLMEDTVINSGDFSDIVVGSTKLTSNKRILSLNETKNLTFRVWLTYDEDVNQNKYIGKELVGKLRIRSNETTTFADVIKANTPPVATPTTAPGQVAATTNEGLITGPTDDYGETTYYYRGAVTNNYVSFANKTWRIVRINGDGTVRLILDNYIDTTGSRWILAEYEHDYYASTGLEAQTKMNYESSLVKENIDSWYSLNIGNTTEFSRKVAKSKFCNDRSVSLISDDYYAFAPYLRLIDNNPSLICSNISYVYDLNVGLLTADEIAYAGARSESMNQLYYLYNSNFTTPAGWWALSPRSLDVDGGADEIAEYTVTINGSLSLAPPYYSYGIRPVISLASDVSVSTASETNPGTSSNPYIVGDRISTVVTVDPITNLTTSNITSNSLSLSWSASSNASYYKVLRKENDGNYAAVNSNTTSASLSETGLDPNTIYTYKVKACKTSGEEEVCSNGVTTIATTSASVGSIASLEVTDSTTNSISLEWSEASSAEYYVVERKTGSGEYSTIQSNIPAINYTDIGLTNGTTYTYRVKGCAVNKTDSSVVCSSTSEVTGTAILYLGDIASLTSSNITPNSIKIQWTPSSNSEYYKIERKQGSGQYSVIENEVSGLYYTNLGLNPSTSYTYRVRGCIDADGVEQCSTTKELTTSTSVNNSFASAILTNNPAVASPTTEPGVDVATTNEGLIIGPNDDYGASTYYFRGAVPNNYVSFAGLTWRIVRINGNGTVRMVAQHYIDYEIGTEWNTETGSITSEGLDYVTYANSPIKTALQTWYDQELNNLNQNLIARTKFCSDKSGVLGFDENNMQYFGPALRLDSDATQSISPSMSCPNSSDIYNLNIGLLSADEVAFAGTTMMAENLSCYLYNSDLAFYSNSWWTMSPYVWSDDSGIAAMNYAAEDGSLNYSYLNNSAALRPVVNISADVQYTTESATNPGTSTNPYLLGNDYSLEVIHVDPATNLTQDSATTSSIKLSWDAGDKASYYKLYKKTGSESYKLVDNYIDKTNFNVVNLNENTTYNFKLLSCALDNDEEEVCSTTSTLANGTTEAYVGNVTSFTTSNIQKNSLRVQWSPAINATFYKLERKNENGTFTTISNNITALYYDDSNLVAGTDYYYKLSACKTNSVGGTSCSSAKEMRVTTEMPTSFSDLILANTPPTTATTTPGQVRTSTNEGLINGDVDDYGDTTYYYRGAVTNNYVSFADLTWRIVRLNGDGSVKMILDDYVDTTGSAWNTNYNSTVYATAINYSTYTDSTIKTALERWYSDNIASSESKEIARGIYCSDKSRTWSTNNGQMQLFNIYARLYPSGSISTATPQMTCPDSDDLYNLKVGLITSDEVEFSGNVLAPSGTTIAAASPTYYLYNLSLTSLAGWWTSTIARWDSSSNGAIYGAYVNDSSTNSMITDSNNINTTLGVRPVINISADALASTTSSTNPGTSTNPYIVYTED